MEFLDEDVRPRFQLQSKTRDQSTAATHRTLSKPFLFIVVALSSSLIVFSLFFLHSEPFKSLLLWLSLSLLLGPFAPPSVTAGDVRVGHGPAVEFPSPPTDDADDPLPEKKSKSKARRSERPEAPAMVETEAPGERKPAPKVVEEETWEEREWTEEEIEVLRKQLVKNPAGMPGRWEAIAESFRGKHRLESVIRKAKDAGERKRSDEDSYSEFLRKRKPADKRLLAEQETGDSNSGEEVWSSGEDIALLNALKAFPKEVALRWEKVAAAVPGKTKAACVKRVAELKKGFRSSKKAATGEDEES